MTDEPRAVVEDFGRPETGSYVNNCIIKARQGDTLQLIDPPLFLRDWDRGVIIARLDGYAVVPREEYEALVRAAELIEAEK